MEKNTRSLFDACRKDDIKQVVEILKSGEVDINEEEEDGFTPLLSATLFTQEELVRTLLKFPELKLDKRDSLGMTALHQACEENSVSIVRMICEDKRCNPCFVNMKDDSGNTALMRAVKSGFVNIVKELDKVEGVDFRTKDELGRDLVEVAKDVMKIGYNVLRGEDFDAVLKYLKERNKKVESLKVISAYNVVKYVKNESDVEALEIPLILKHLVAGFLDNQQYMNDENKVYSGIDEDLDDLDLYDDLDYLDSDFDEDDIINADYCEYDSDFYADDTDEEGVEN